jgi:peptidoglycan LD-endopeptidase CwlK
MTATLTQAKLAPARLTPASVAKLATCDHRLQAVVNAVATQIPCVVLEGHRGPEAQNAAYAAGNTQLKWPHGKHNSLPGRAVDLAPTPIDWKDRKRFSMFAGFMLGTAAAMNVKLRWGGDWNEDFRLADNSFDDLVHFELMD